MTENGWPPDTDAHPFVSIPLSECVQITIPGTTETLWFQKGAPAIILPAFLADLNAYIESSNNTAGYADEGSWTNGNSVGTSNHLGATAFDFNWTDHPMGPAPEDPAAGWQGSDLIAGDEVPAVQALLDWYEGTVYWGGNWDSPKDSMHFQMGYDTYDPSQGQAGTAAVQDFIKRKIRADGFSTYRRGATDGGDDASNEQPPTFDRAKAITALYDAVPVIDEDRAAQLVDQVMAGLALAQCNNAKRIAMALAQWGHESDGFNTTEEYAKNGPYAPYIGRTWIQITWQSNYAAFGKWCYDRGLVDDPNAFVNNPPSLADMKWAGIGPAWYWTVARPTINSLCDQGDVVGVTQLINGGQNGIDDRTARYNQAIALGDELLALITPPATDQGDTITLPENVSADKFNKLCDDVAWMREQMDVSRPDWDADADLGQDSQGRPNNERTAIAKILRTVTALAKPAAPATKTSPPAKKTVKKAAPKKTARR